MRSTKVCYISQSYLVDSKRDKLLDNVREICYASHGDRKQHSEDRMALILLPGLKNEYCKCTRSLDRVHCPQCGARNVYSLTKTCQHPFVDSNGATQVGDFTVFRCRSCSHVFDEFELVFQCEAPLPRSNRVSRAVRQGVDEAIKDNLREIGDSVRSAATPEERKTALAELLRESGLFKKEEV